VDPVAPLAVRLELVASLSRRLAGARDPTGDVDRDYVGALGEQRLISGHEVADRGLRGRRARLALAQALVEVRVLPGRDIGFTKLLALERDVEADRVDSVLGDHLLGEVGGRVRDHRGLRA
jgi:hypothetical protein